MIEVANISKRYGEIEALRDVSCKFKEGEIVALLGQNGAGKSTLLKIIVGFLLPDDGSVKIMGKDYSCDREDILSHIGYVPENSFLYPEMSVFDFLKMSADLQKIEKDEVFGAIVSVAEQLQIKNVLLQSTATLSKGYKKRVEIAAVLLGKPKILILDEPTEGLDPLQKEVVRKFLREYSRHNLVIISTHILEEVKAVASRIVMLSSGKISADLSRSQLNNITLENLFK